MMQTSILNFISKRPKLSALQESNGVPSFSNGPNLGDCPISEQEMDEGIGCSTVGPSTTSQDVDPSPPSKEIPMSRPPPPLEPPTSKRRKIQTPGTSSFLEFEHGILCCFGVLRENQVVDVLQSQRENSCPTWRELIVLI